MVCAGDMDARNSSLSIGADLLPHGAESVSPVTLSSDWSRVARLLLLASLAVVGSVGNVFMVSAVMIEDHLKKRGNAFVVNVALADLLITGLVMPSSAVVILADVEGSLSVCKFQWFVAALCFLVAMLSLAATAAENYGRLCTGEYGPGAADSECLSRGRVTAIIVAGWLVCGVASGLQFASDDLGFDYCRRRSPGLVPYQAAVAVVFVFAPVSLTLLCYARAACRVRSFRQRPSFKPPVTFAWDCALMKTNAYSFGLFCAFWLPFGVALAVGTVKPIADKVFYNLAWFALSKSCVNNILYCVTNRHFRNAYVNLFHYCCCKTTVSFSRRQRGDGARPTGDVRVHIIPGYNMYTSPQRARDCPGKRTASCRPTTSSRDVYEL